MCATAEEPKLPIVPRHKPVSLEILGGGNVCLVLICPVCLCCLEEYTY